MGNMDRGLFVLSSVVAAKTVTLATFDGAKETSLTWKPVNDPVMGGQSVSTFSVESPLGIFEGEVKVVKFLGAAGFCNLETTGSISFPDVSGTDGITVAAKQTLDGGLKNFDVRFSTTQTNAARRGAAWEADFKVADGETSYFVPYSAFSCQSRGQVLTTCGDIAEQLSDVTQIVVGSGGVAGPFRLELSSIAATTKDSEEILDSAAARNLVTFDGAKETAFSFRQLNDPVMGGKSTGTWALGDGYGILDGEVIDVPSLSAPGFIKAAADGKFPDISSFIDGSLVLSVRTTTPEFAGYRVTLTSGAASPDFSCAGGGGLPFSRGCFKNKFSVPAGSDFIDVKIPFNTFSDKWSSATGEQTTTCEDDEDVCPTAAKLAKIQRLEFWGEGALGKLHLEVQSVSAETAAGERVQLV